MIEGVSPISVVQPMINAARRRTLLRKNGSYDDDTTTITIENNKVNSTSSSCYATPINNFIGKKNNTTTTAPFLSLIVHNSNNNNNNNNMTSDYISPSCHFYEHSSNYQESMPKDIILSTSAPENNVMEKMRNKYIEEFPTEQCSINNSNDQGGGQGQKQQQHRTSKARQQKSRFRTTPITFEELREVDEEVYLKQHKDEQPQEQNEEIGPFRQKSWSFSPGTTRRSPSPTRKNSPRSWHLQPLNSLHPLNWRPLSQESLLNFNSLSTLPTIPEERRLLNSPLTPLTDTAVGQQQTVDASSTSTPTTVDTTPTTERKQQ